MLRSRARRMRSVWVVALWKEDGVGGCVLVCDLRNVLLGGGMIT